MIKSFKDFDEEFRSQKVYEANNYDYDNEDVLIDDSIIPDLISDDKILLQISNIILKSLNDPKNGLGKFTIKPTVIQLNNTPSAYFYNKDKSINIVACRKNSIKYVYLFKKFDLGSNNIADLVLSTNTTGFKEIIDRLISRLSSFNSENYINEARKPTYNWQENYASYAAYTDKEVSCFKELSTESRNSIFKIIIDEISRNPTKPVNSSSKMISDNILDELKEIYIRKGISFPTSTIRIKIASAFYKAYSGETEHADDMSKLFLNTDYEPGKTIVTKKDEITEEKDVTTYSKETAFFDEEEYIEGFKEFKRTMQDIFDTTCSLCNYVKNNGELSKKDIKQTRGKRCMVITGRPGTGKSEYVYQALTKMQMRPDKDYHIFTSANTAAESLYKAFYNYNGKLLIFDDTADLFNSQYKGSLWQNAFQKTVHRSVIASPKKSTDDDSKKSLKTYSTTDITRQERYFLEVGNKSNAIKRDFIEKEKEKITIRYKEEHGIDDIEIKLSDKDKRTIDRLVEKSWNEHSSKIKPAMPDSFNYSGVVIIITNKKRAVLASDKIMGEIWKSIESRAKNFSVDPGNQEIWLAIKEKIIKQTDDFNDGKIKDPEICMIPPGVADKFIEFVEHTFATETKYQYMTFRTVAEDIHSLFADGWEDKRNPNWWHYEVKLCMKNRDYDN